MLLHCLKPIAEAVSTSRIRLNRLGPIATLNWCLARMTKQNYMSHSQQIRQRNGGNCFHIISQHQRGYWETVYHISAVRSILEIRFNPWNICAVLLHSLTVKGNSASINSLNMSFPWPRSLQSISVNVSSSLWARNQRRKTQTCDVIRYKV